ncbi:sulfurtransferase TusA family protein [Thermoproteus tenax]|uniref:Predicted redox protein, regulator of disulfide bond formation n=1 Tax=Thermoproteus tenax (strain ATCC 35583 / DSM 2078 / JCM 9277 / NBRC 100435 / Kra 1) TaxID=768679 RepID=G4RP06_THETK|nr:sulfurtransferase TusA family protein [Thermoproteus tenax]CCC81300.1 predicted redox protein, regulator of disulfide bond formation [Thermoproteus tenax Kra 1]
MSEGRIKVDARGIACPGPITELVKAYRNAKNGDIIEVWATDPGFKPDVEAWIKRTGNRLLELRQEGNAIVAVIKVTAKK